MGAETLRGTGQLPKFQEDLFKLSEPVNGREAYLIPTAEVSRPRRRSRDAGPIDDGLGALLTFLVSTVPGSSVTSSHTLSDASHMHRFRLPTCTPATSLRRHLSRSPMCVTLLPLTLSARTPAAPALLLELAI